MEFDIQRTFLTEQQHYGSTYFRSKLLDRTPLTTVPPSQFPVLSVLLILNINHSRNFNTLAKETKALQIAVYLYVYTALCWQKQTGFPAVDKDCWKQLTIPQTGAFPLCMSPDYCKQLVTENQHDQDGYFSPGSISIPFLKE